jgi:hypothetical protein
MKFSKVFYFLSRHLDDAHVKLCLIADFRSMLTKANVWYLLYFHMPAWIQISMKITRHLSVSVYASFFFSNLLILLPVSSLEAVNMWLSVTTYGFHISLFLFHYSVIFFLLSNLHLVVFTATSELTFGLTMPASGSPSNWTGSWELRDTLFYRWSHSWNMWLVAWAR